MALTARKPNQGGKRCVVFGEAKKQMGNGRNPLDRPSFTPFDDKQKDALETFDVDFEAVMKNILACNGGQSDLGDAANIDYEGPYPPCMFPAVKIEGIPEEPKSTERGTQSCTATDKGVYLRYHVYVYLDFEQSACNKVKERIKHYGSGNYKTPTHYSCDEDDNGFHFAFDYGKTDPIKSGDIMNKAFGDIFPNEGGEYGNINGFNCPDY